MARLGVGFQFVPCEFVRLRCCEAVQIAFSAALPPSIIAHQLSYRQKNIDGYGSNRGATEPGKQKSHSEEWLNCLILLVPPNGIEPLPDDYKSTARPSCYGGTLHRNDIIA